MTDFEKQIYDVISRYNGIKGAEIANILQVEKKLVNSTLANSSALKAVVKQTSDYKWHLIIAVKSDQNTQTALNPDNDLRKLCIYYLHCIGLESSSSVSQFLNNRYGGYVVLNDLKINPEKDAAAISLLKKIASDRSIKAYLGYPVRIYTIYAKDGTAYKKIAPVFLFPIEYTSGAAEISMVPAINMEVIKGYCVGGVENLASELVSLETELGMNNPDSDADTDELVLRLRQVRDWEWMETIDPYNIPVAENITGFQDGIFNRPVVIQAKKATYTDGLESELTTLSMMPEDNYRDTVLYSWVKGSSQSNSEDSPLKQILEVLPLNTEQITAVETALSSDLTIITGPPGTGKSQVVTDLLASIAWNGNSALFSSRNNKAVDVVDKRINGLSVRPCLLRIGNNQYASRLAEIIEGLLSSSATQQDESELECLQQEYEKLISREKDLKSQKAQVIQNRNDLDEAEQNYCLSRNIVGTSLFVIDENDIGNIKKSAEAYNIAVNRAKKENNSFFARLFWSSTEPRRIADLGTAEKLYEVFASRYDLIKIEPTHSEENAQAILAAAKEFENALPAALKYRKALKKVIDTSSLEKLDLELLSIKKLRADIAQKLWDKWLRASRATFSASERKEMSNFVAAIKLANRAEVSSDTGLQKQYVKMIRLIRRYLQCWAVTSLSAKSRIPFEAGLFDYVIIDEASQCDIASIIPLLFRAKHAVIIGDPKQLQHISQLTSKQDMVLLQKYGIEPVWSYSVNSLYALAAAKALPEHIIQLRDHFRSCAEIIDYSNETFYDGSLRTATRYDKLKIPPGEKPGIRWINVAGTTIRPSSGSAYNNEEVMQVVTELKRLIKVGYSGSIGVTTPFNLQAEKIMQALEKESDLLTELVSKHAFLADTVHKFQGDERDLMIFSSVVTDSAPSVTLGFLNSTGNLFNVAVTRARSTLVVVGDYRYCHECSISYLQQFASYYGHLMHGGRRNSQDNILSYTRDYPKIQNTPTVSDWEKILYTALFDAGVKTIPQYPVDRYSLDLALMLPNGRRLDIEVDGEMYHRNWNNELCYRDQLRNQRLFELGWDVKRFWVYQIRDDLPWCINQVKDWYNEAKTS